MTPEQKAFASALCKLVADGASYIPGDAQEITDFILTELSAKFADQTEKASLNDFFDSAEQVILAGGAAFGS